MFGDWGSWIAQLIVTIAVVVGLIALIYWLVRRYSSGGLGRIGRGRVPRLAIVDAMPVDGRRRLVLVRRDSTEHLLLIGGPSDLVVEHSIQRRPRPGVRPQQQPAPGEGARAESAPVSPPPAGDNPPIPFPTPVRSQPQPGVTPLPSDRNPVPTPRRNPPQPAPPPAPKEESPPVADAPENAEESVQGPERKAFFSPEPAFTQDPLPRPAAPFVNPHPVDIKEESPSPDPDTAAKVNDLEREMARLLGEITAKPAS